MSEIDSDPLYRYLFDRAQSLYEGRPVLIDEAASLDDACRIFLPDRKMQRAWLYDDSGLHQLSDAEFRTYCDQYYSSDDEPYVLFSFHISRDRKRVAVSHLIFSLAGAGGVWLVEDGKNGIDLKPAPNTPWWIS